MSWFGRAKSKARVARESRDVDDALRTLLESFISTRRGVEAWIEAASGVNKPSILLIAADGESTRRAVPSVEFGRSFAAEHSIPAYDAGVVPYPQRLRDYGVRNRPPRQRD